MTAAWNSPPLPGIRSRRTGSRTRARDSPDDPEAGAVTVEAALGVAAVVAVFVLALTALSIVLGQIRCTDAAVEAARLAARGDRAGAQQSVQRLAPNGARSAISVRDGEVIAEVSAPPAVGFLPARWWTSRAVAALEPGAEPEQGGPDTAGATSGAAGARP